MFLIIGQKFDSETLKNCLSGATTIVKNSDKEKYMCSSYEKAFNGKVSWNFNDDVARNVLILEVDTSSSSHTDNLENDFLILGEGDTFGINASFGAPEKNQY